MSTLSITMKSADRDLLIEHASISGELKRLLRFGIVQGKDLLYELDEEAIDEICDALTMALSSVADKKVRRRLEAILDHLESCLVEEEEEEGQDEVAALLEEIRKLPEDAPESEGRALLVQLQEALKKEALAIEAQLLLLVSACSELNREQCLGLSQEHLSHLAAHVFGDADSPVQFTTDLPEALLADHRLIHGTVAVLRLMRQKGKVRMRNESGEFPERFLREAWAHGAGVYVDGAGAGKPDKQALNFLLNFCYQLEFIGLIDAEEDSYELSERGGWFLDQASSSERFMELFDGFFANPDINQIEQFSEIPFLVETFGYSLYAIHKFGDTPWTVQDHWHELFLPSLFGLIPEENINAYFVTVVGLLLLMPLEELGLVVSEAGENAEGKSELFIRKTPLFDAFITFQWPS
ncbi:MAG: hypothetical protein HYV27_18145 [Candidatus Hydrogenedentes bacterium]|nr:hypothetical protein [Candidatus Hydrogenedentota bacterium]